MKAESIMSQITGLFAGNVRSGKEAKQEAGVSFGDVMQKNASAKDNPDSKLAVGTSKSDTFKKDVQSVVKAEQPDQADVPEKDVPEKDFAAVAETVQETETGENVLSQETVVSAIDDAIRDVIKDILDITDEELDTLLTELGIPCIALLDVSNLQQFVVLAGGEEDVTALLTDETLANTFTQLSEAMEELQIPETFHVDEETLKELVQGAQEDQAQKFTEVLAGAKQQTPDAEQPVQSPEVRTQEQQPMAEGPVITVEAEGNLSGQQNNGMAEDDGNTDAGFSGSTEASEKTDAPHTAADSVQVFAQNLAQAGQTVRTEQAEARTAQMVDIVNQVVEQIKVVMKQDVTSMEMQLNPEHLGKVSLTVSAKEGVMTASFVVQSEAAKEALESQMQILKDQFNEKSIKVEAVEVTVSDFAFAQSDQTDNGEQPQSKNRNRTLRMTEEEEGAEETAAEDLAAKVMADSGGSIDYTA